MDNIDDDSTSGDEIDVSKLPPVEECERRCQEFARITKTDVACAQFYMQDRNWDLEASILAYFDENGSKLKRPASPLFGNQTKTRTLVTGVITVGRPIDRVKIASWNIDGLDTKNLRPRVSAVAKKILQESLDVVFLQEVVPDNELLLRSQLQDRYTIISGQENNDYYTAMLLKRDVIKLIEFNTLPFEVTHMGRNLLVAKMELKSVGLPFVCITTHLESCKEHSAVRSKQLKAAFSVMSENAKTQPVFFGGDLNVRDSEVTEVGLPAGVVDLWQDTGSRPEARYTWDLRRNTNLQLSGYARHRFDRLYYAAPVGEKPPGFFTPLYFELIGLEKVPHHQVFPSDHWGILVHVNVDEVVAKSDAGQSNEDQSDTSDQNASEGNDSEGDAAEKNDSEADTAEKNDSEADTADKNDSEADDSEADAADKNDSEADTAEKNDSEADTSDKNDSEADTADKNDSEADNAEQKDPDDDTKGN